MALRLDLEFGANDAFRGMDRLISGMKSLESQIKSLASAFSGVKSGGATAADDINKTASAARSAIGPMERLARAKEQLAKAEASGDDTQIFDAKHAVVRAQRAMSRADAMVNPKGPNGVADLIGTSRLAIGPNGKLQLMPLMNRMMASGLAGLGDIGGILNLAGGAGGGGAIGGAAAGGAALGGPMGLALTGAASAIMFMATAAKTAADTITEFTKATFTAGGSGMQTAALMRVGAALGIDSAGRARQFGDKIWTDGIAKGYASQLGIDTRGGPFGNLNDAQKYLAAVSAISDPNRFGDQQAMRMARSFGLEDELLLRKASPGMRNRALGVMGREYSEREQTNAVDAQVGMNLAMNDLKLQLVDLGSMALPPLVEVIGVVTDAFHMLEAPLQLVAKNMPRMPGLGDIPIVGGFFGGKQQSPQDIAMSDHSRAMGEHSRALRENTEIIAGGKNIRGAVPIGWRYQIADQGLRGNASALGGAGLGGVTL